MKIATKIKNKLGLCNTKGCFRRATLDMEIPLIEYKGEHCDKCFENLEGMNIFNSKELIVDKECVYCRAGGTCNECNLKYVCNSFLEYKK